MLLTCAAVMAQLLRAEQPANVACDGSARAQASPKTTDEGAVLGLGVSDGAVGVAAAAAGTARGREAAGASNACAAAAPRARCASCALDKSPERLRMRSADAGWRPERAACRARNSSVAAAAGALAAPLAPPRRAAALLWHGADGGGVAAVRYRMQFWA